MRIFSGVAHHAGKVGAKFLLAFKAFCVVQYALFLNESFMLRAKIKRYDNRKDRQIFLRIDSAFQRKNTENRRKQNGDDRFHT